MTYSMARPMAMARPISAPRKRVPRKEVAQTQKSILETLNRRKASPKSSSPCTPLMTMAASAHLGMNVKGAVMNSRVRSTIVAVKNEASAVLPPVSWFTALRLKLPVAGYEEKPAPMMLESPRARSSWLGLSSYLFLAAKALAMDTDSMSPTMAHTTAVVTSSLLRYSSPNRQEEKVAGGMPSGKSPTTGMPLRSSRAPYVMAMLMTLTVRGPMGRIHRMRR
mmetsp:Transcript_36105/g.101710  ORF Transcript_36105/g.101710 Transcript_36105/m.101710 type:complete len:222 (-) Transcript_36105:917-1582(-)